MHHRYQLNPDLIPALEKAGLRISARSKDGQIVDGVEFAGHPFFIGLEGHPELTSMPNAANPAISEFVRRALQHKSVKD
jgi:CTP synthase